MFDLPSVIRNSAFLLFLRVSGTISSMVLFNAILVAVPPAIKSRFSKKNHFFHLIHLPQNQLMNLPKMMERNFCIRGARVVLMESVVGEVLMKKSCQEEMILMMIIFIKR